MVRAGDERFQVLPLQELNLIEQQDNTRFAASRRLAKSREKVAEILAEYAGIRPSTYRVDIHADFVAVRQLKREGLENSDGLPDLILRFYAMFFKSRHN